MNAFCLGDSIPSAARPGKRRAFGNHFLVLLVSIVPASRAFVGNTQGSSEIPLSNGRKRFLHWLTHHRMPG